MQGPEAQLHGGNDKCQTLKLILKKGQNKPEAKIASALRIMKEYILKHINTLNQFHHENDWPLPTDNDFDETMDDGSDIPEVNL